MVRKTSKKSRNIRSKSVSSKVSNYKIPKERAAKVGPFAFGNALGWVSVISLALYVVMYWWGGYDNIDLVISQFPVEFSVDNWSVFVGFIQAYVLGYIGGWIFAHIYNKFVR